MDHPAQEQGAARYGLPLRDALDAFSPEEVRAAFYRPPAPTEAEVQGRLAERRRAEEERALRDGDRRVTFERRDWFGRATSRPSPHDEAHRHLAKASWEAAERALRGAFLGRLRSGELIAHGRAGGIGGAWTRIEPDMWPHLMVPDWKAGAVVSKVKSDATAFYGVRVGWPEAGLSWRNAVLACCEHGKVNHLAGLMADGYPRGGVGFLGSGYSQSDEDEAGLLWEAAEQRLFGDIRAGRLRVTVNDPDKTYGRIEMPRNLGDLIEEGVIHLRAHHAPSMIRAHRHLVNGVEAGDQCLVMSRNGQPIADVPEEQLHVLRGLSVEPVAVTPVVVRATQAAPVQQLPSTPSTPARRIAAAVFPEVADWILSEVDRHPAWRKGDWRRAARERHSQLSERDFNSRIWPLVTKRRPDLAQAGRPPKKPEEQVSQTRRSVQSVKAR